MKVRIHTQTHKSAYINILGLTRQMIMLGILSQMCLGVWLYCCVVYKLIHM